MSTVYNPFRRRHVASDLERKAASVVKTRSLLLDLSGSITQKMMCLSKISNVIILISFSTKTFTD